MVVIGVIVTGGDWSGSGGDCGGNWQQRMRSQERGWQCDNKARMHGGYPRAGSSNRSIRKGSSNNPNSGSSRCEIANPYPKV